MIDSSNMAWALAALAPCSTMSRANVSAPTTRMPRVTIPIPVTVVAIAAAAMRKPTLRVQPGRLIAGPRPLVWSQLPVQSRRHPIARPTHGHDEARGRRRVCKLVAKPADVDVDRPVEDAAASAP